MKLLNVQFTDSTKKAVSSIFSSPQDSDAFPNQDTVSPSDSRVTEYIESLPEFMRAQISDLLS